MIVSIVILTNIGIQMLIMYLSSGSVSNIPIISIMYTFAGMLGGTIIGIPIMCISAFPFLLNFNNRRKDILLSGIILNAILVFMLAVIILLLIYIANTIAQSLPIYYMGFMIDELTLVSGLMLFGFNFILLFTVSNAIYFISTVFYRLGIMYGFSVLALCLSGLAIVGSTIYEVYVWSYQQFLIGLLMLIVSMLFIYGSWKMLSKADIKKSSFKKRDILVLTVTVALLAFCLNSSGDVIADNSTYRTPGQFSYIESELVGNQFIAKDGNNLYINWRSQLESGIIQLQIINPLNEVVYEAAGNDLDITKIPLSAGAWKYNILIENATEGHYDLKVLLK
jgi:hypothetical protein